jgi:hypothetical protein
MSLLIDDIQEELRREDLMQRFKKAFPWIVGLVVLILLFAASDTWVKGRREKQMVHYEFLYESAIECINNKDTVQAKTILADIAKNCKGMRFLALMTLADMEKNALLQGLSGNQATSRSDLIHVDAQLISWFADRQFHQFLSLCRLFLDAQYGQGYFGPLPLGVPKSLDKVMEKLKTAPSAIELDNAMAMYRSAPEWAPLSTAIDIMKLPKGPAQQEAMRRWIELFQGLLGPNGTIPLYALMGSVAEVRP